MIPIPLRCRHKVGGPWIKDLNVFDLRGPEGEGQSDPSDNEAGNDDQPGVEVASDDRHVLVVEVVDGKEESNLVANHGCSNDRRQDNLG